MIVKCFKFFFPMLCKLTLLPFAVILVLLTGCDNPEPAVMNHREVRPPPGEGSTGDICIIVRNRAPFTITGRVQLKSRERATFRLSRNKSRKLCVSGTLYGNNTVSFVLTNFVTLPLFSCYTRYDRAIDVYAERRGDTWIYSATCQA